MLYMLWWSAGAGMGDNTEMLSHSSLWLLKGLADKAENMSDMQKISDHLVKYRERNIENKQYPW